MSQHRDPEFLEADIATYITRLLERCRMSRPDVQVCQISQAEENGVGYDACITSICPFFVQLKRSYFYTPDSTSAIITDRTKLKLPTSQGVYFFKLHRTSKHANELQHNALHRLAQSEVAAYLAPLFFRRRSLESIPEDYALWAWSYGPVSITDSRHMINISRVRLFHNLITIPPHAPVTSANHRYSYTSPADVCFHSDPEPVQGPNIATFAGLLQRLETEGFQERGARMRSPQQAAEDVVPRLPEVLGLNKRSHALREVVSRGFEQVLGPDYKIPSNPTLALINMQLGPLPSLRIFGNILEYEWGIRQYAVVKRAQ
ncbi:hypothetical protein WME95_42865 [Sorangium sp. So ce327]|uniref:hypothetical protein n=1 Tax=Sorangium sp. So ce327 TaxID=3133301 RepID=UPI003F602EAB